MYIVTGETRSAGCLCNSSRWFNHIEPHRTYTNHIITEIAMCVEVYHMSSGWFDCTEPSLCTLLQRKEGVQGAYALVRGGTYALVQGGSSTSNHFITDSKVWRVLTHEFGVVRPYRNFSINIVKGETRCAGCLCTSSGWLKHIEPHRTYTNPCNDVDREGSVQSNHPELM